jgi:hypothetical protein
MFCQIDAWYGINIMDAATFIILKSNATLQTLNIFNVTLYITMNKQQHGSQLRIIMMSGVWQNAFAPENATFKHNDWKSYKNHFVFKYNISPFQFVLSL